MKKLVLAIFVFIFIANISTAQHHGSGVLLDDSAFNKPIKQPRLSQQPLQGIYAAPPLYVSFRNHTPAPGDQGECESCLGWACAYEALTTMWAIQHGVTDQGVITENAYDPNYLYYSIADSCSQGSQITKAMLAMQTKGVVLIKDLPGPVTGKMSVSRDKLHKILLYNKLFELTSNNQNIVEATESELASGYPVVVVCIPDDNLYNLKGPKKAMIWKPSTGPKPNIGHAMCVIGYNHSKRQFEVMNSWGVKWGDKGYFYIDYDDFANAVRYAYFITPNLGYDDKQQVSIVDVAGDFEIDKYFPGSKTRVKEIKPRVSGDQYVISKDIKEGDIYRFSLLNVQNNMNEYVIGLGPDNRANILFPAPFPGAKGNPAQVSITDDDNIFITPLNKNGSDKLDAGVYHYCVLYSRNVVEINDVVQQINQKRGSHSLEQVREILGPRLIPKSSIDYTRGSINGQDVINAGDIVPAYFTINVTK